MRIGASTAPIFFESHDATLALHDLRHHRDTT